MPLRGEADTPTYANVTNLPDQADVFIARHVILGENCIQKTYRPEGREDAIMFAEPRLLNELDHEHITPIREAQWDPDRPGCVTFVMPVYAGGSVLAAMSIGAHRFGIMSAVAVLTDVAQALAYLHTEKGYAHRDVKPSNILLDETRSVGYLSDFGSAAQLQDRVARAIRTTPLYQPPEVGLTGRVGAAGDVYALGLTAFEMLNGLIPYDSLDPLQIDKRVSQGRRALPDRFLASSAFAPHVPSALTRIVRRMLDSDPGRRPTASEVVRQLRSAAVVAWEPRAGNEWLGKWPPNRRDDRKTELRVVATEIGAGRNRGLVRLVATYRTATSGGWRRVGVADSFVAGHDAAAVAAFFRTVDDHVASRWAAR